MVRLLTKIDEENQPNSDLLIINFKLFQDKIIIILECKLIILTKYIFKKLVLINSI